MNVSWFILDETSTASSVGGSSKNVIDGRHRLAARAADLIASADALIITAGAGMGVDSGLPDFRSGKGFWDAYPALARAQLSFEAMACPQTFIETPDVAWGFYGHRLNLYRATAPHDGFRLLLDMAKRVPLGAFVFTSNVDGQFQKANFDELRIMECHGSIHHLQCIDACEEHVWSASAFHPEVDAAQCMMRSRLPTCPHCRRVARPNVLLFNDWRWLAERKYQQQLRYRQWRAAVNRPVVIEIGAGTAIASVRAFGEEQRCPMIRINPTDADLVRAEGVSLTCSGLPGIGAIADALAASGFFDRSVQRLGEADDLEWWQASDCVST